MMAFLNNWVFSYEKEMHYSTLSLLHEKAQS
jgi:hypothetical protein